MAYAKRLRGHGLRTVANTGVAAALAGSCLAVLLLGLGPLTQRYRLLTVQSGSMRPTLPVGAVIVLTPQPLRDVQVGNVITFSLPTNRRVLETHRVVQIIQRGDHPVVITKGDANVRPDPWQLKLLTGPVWRVRMVVPHLGYELAWLRQSLVRILAGIIAPLLLTALWLTEIWRPRPARPPGAASHARTG
jgi:signal peptidase